MDPGSGFFALGADRDESGRLRPLAVRASNMGHLLDSRLLDGNDERTTGQREAVVRALFMPDLLCAAGVRTLSSRAVRFRPGAYHNGSSWPWDTCTIAQGLHRHGYHALAWELRRRIWATCERHRLFPEFARGGREPEPELNARVVDVIDASGRPNRIEQPPQQIQGWTVAAAINCKAAWRERVLHRTGAFPVAARDSHQSALEHEVLGPGLRE